MERAAKRVALSPTDHDEAPIASILPQLPRELIHIIWELRARERLIDYIAGVIESLEVRHSHLLGATDYCPTDKRPFIHELCQFLQDNKAVITGSACVHATMGNTLSLDGDDDWEPEDIDIFVCADTLHEKYEQRFYSLLKRYIPKAFAVRHSDGTFDSTYSTRSTKHLHTYEIHLEGNSQQVLAKFQIIVVDPKHKTPFCAELSKLPIERRLYEVFDIKVCASYFDGVQFRTTDLQWTMHGISRVAPTGLFSTRWKDLELEGDGKEEKRKRRRQPLFIEGKTPRMNRPYTINATRKSFRHQLHSSSDMFSGATKIFYGVLREWIEANATCGWRDMDRQVTRIRRYIGRGLTLFLNSPFATLALAPKVTIIDKDGLIGNVSQSRLEQKDRRYTCKWK